MTNHDDNRPRIMVVDDTPANLRLLEEMLSKGGRRVLPFPRGGLALDAMRKHPPDLVLLDINMPGMDGYEVCGTMQSDPVLREIPVIFLSAMNDTFDKVRAFRAGGVDYVTKPVQFEELQSRIETHLTIGRMRKELKDRYERLKQMEMLKDKLTHLIVHDMRSPLMGISGYLDLLALKGGELDKETKDYLGNMRASCSHLSEMINDMLDITRMEDGSLKMQLRRFDMRDLVRQAVHHLGGLAKGRDLTLDLPPEPVEASCDDKYIVRTLENLVGNAIKFTSKKDPIRVCVMMRGERVRVEVHDKGPGIPEETRSHIFDKFGQLKAVNKGRRRSHGLGLTFARLTLEAHEGSIGVESTVGEGSTFWFELAAAESNGLSQKAERSPLDSSMSSRH